MPFPDIRSTSQPQSWEVLEHLFGSLRVAFWLILTTPWIVFLVVIWPLVVMSHKRHRYQRRSNPWDQRKIRGGEVQHTGVVPFLKSLKALSDVALKMASVVDQQLSTSNLAPRNKRYNCFKEQQRNRR